VLPPGEELRAERRRDQRTVRQVVGRVHRDHRVVEHWAHDLGQDPRRVGLVVSQHGHRVVVPHNVERRVCCRPFAALDRHHVAREWPLRHHRAAPTRGRQVRIRIVDAAELDRVGQLEGVELHAVGVHRHLRVPATSERATLWSIRFQSVDRILTSM
jgi:hypothetical protein